MIKSLKLVNVKGCSGTHTFGPITVITGENAVGKSAILEAAVIDLIGYHPSLGRLPSLTRKLASGKVMSISSDNGTYTRSQTWGAKYEASTVPPEVAFAESDMVSLVEFNKLTEADKTKYLLKKCATKGDPKQVWTRIIEQMNSNGHGEAMARINDDPPGTKAGYFDKLQATKAANPVEYIDAISMDVKEKLRNTKSELDGAKAATSEILIQTASGSLADTVLNVQPLINDANKRKDEAHKVITQEFGKMNTLDAELAAIKAAGKKEQAELTALKTQKDDKPKCSRCAGPVECPACSMALVDMSPAIAVKQKEVETLLGDWKEKNWQVGEAKKAYAEVSALLTPIENELIGLGMKQAKFNANQGKAGAADLAASKIAALEEKKLVFTKFVDVVNELAEVILTESIGGVLSVANSLIGPVAGFDLVFNDGFGYMRGPQFVSLATLSGSQSLVVCAGIQLALAAKTPEKVLLIDELGRMTDATKSKFITTIASLIQAKVLHQMIGIDPQVNPEDTFAKWLSSQTDIDDELVADIMKAYAGINRFVYPKSVTIIHVK